MKQLLEDIKTIKDSVENTRKQDIDIENYYSAYNTRLQKLIYNLNDCINILEKIIKTMEK